MDYIKQFPDVMAGKKVMYVHGFGSSAQSGTVSRLRKVLCNATIIAEDMPLHPQEALDLLHHLCEKEKPDFRRAFFYFYFSCFLYLFSLILLSNPSLVLVLFLFS